VKLRHALPTPTAATTASAGTTPILRAGCGFRAKCMGVRPMFDHDEHIHAHLMHEQRAWERANRPMLDAAWNALPDWPRSIAAHLATPVKEGM